MEDDADLLSGKNFHVSSSIRRNNTNVRAGGAFSDEIDPLMDFYIIFDIKFFFFVILILLAIIPGLIDYNGNDGVQALYVWPLVGRISTRFRLALIRTCNRNTI